MSTKKKLKGAYRSFEKTLLLLLEKAKAGPLTVETFLTMLSGKGRVLLLIFLSLTFGQIPGIAFFLGLVIGYLGIKIAIGRSYIWIPKSLLRKKIPSYFLIKAIKQILHFLKFLKKWSRPRYLRFTRQATTRVINGVMIALVGLFFAISPPIPFSSLIAFISIFSIAIGLLNDDGIYIIFGYICAIVYFIGVCYLLKICSFSQICNGVKYCVALFS